MSFVRRAAVVCLFLYPTIAQADDRVRSVPTRPMAFEINRGQTHPRVRFLARNNGYTLFLTPDEAVFSLADGHGGGSSMRMRLVGAQPPRAILGVEPLPGKSHYLRGSDARRWTANVPSYAAVRYENVYRGIDLVYYGNEQQLEYDFIVAPGADPGAIRVRFDGVQGLRLADSGDLVMRAGSRELRQRQPMAYQIIAGARRAIPASYALRRDGIGIRLGEYDRSLPLTIDPVLIYSTFLGGSSETFGATEIAVDAAGAVYVAGGTTSVDFPTTSGAMRTVQGGETTDAFITKFDEAGQVVYSTFFGGHGYNLIGALAVDPAGAVYVAGHTEALDFPTTAGALQTTCPRLPQQEKCSIGFVSKLDPAGSTLLFSTYFGARTLQTPELAPFAADIALDGDLNVILAGQTGRQLPVTPGVLQPEHRGLSWTGFVAKLSATGTTLLYATYLGGDNFDVIQGVDTDRGGNVYLTGQSRSSDFPTTEGAFQRTCPILDVPGPRGCAIAFVTKLNNTATAFVYSTLLGGSATTGPSVNGLSSEGWDIAVDEDGFAFVTGKTHAVDFPTTPGSLRTATVTHDAFVTKLTQDGSGLVYSTLLGGDVQEPGGFMHESGIAIQLDTDGSVYVAGVTSAIDFPLVNPMQPQFGGYSWDAFVARLNPSGTALTFSTFLGGTRTDDLVGLARDAQGNLLVAGQTRSADFPLVNPAQPSFAGDRTNFVTKIGEPTCGTDVTGQVQVFQSAIVPFFWPFHLQLVIVWNSSPSSIEGPVAYVMDDLQNAVFVGASKTRCVSPEGDPLTLVPLGDDNVLAPNEARLLGLWFFQTQLGPISYMPRLLSGPRNY